MAKISEISDTQLQAALRKYQRELRDAEDGASAERARRFLVQIEAERARRAAPRPVKVRMERPQAQAKPAAPKPQAAPAAAKPAPAAAKTGKAVLVKAAVAKEAPAPSGAKPLRSDEADRLIAAVKATPAARAAVKEAARPRSASAVTTRTPPVKRRAAAGKGDPLAFLPPWTGGALVITGYALGVLGVLLLLDYWMFGLLPGFNWFWMVTVPVCGPCYMAGSWLLDRGDRDAMPARGVVEIT